MEESGNCVDDSDSDDDDDDDDDDNDDDDALCCGVVCHGESLSKSRNATVRLLLFAVLFGACLSSAGVQCPPAEPSSQPCLI